MTTGMVLRHTCGRLALALCFGFVLAGCGGQPVPAPGAVRTVEGKVQLPPGAGYDLSTLNVTTPLGSYPVSPSGAFSADVFGGAVSELGVETAAGDLLLLGLTSGSTADASVTSTAQGLLYYAVGGMWLPPAFQDKVRSLLANEPEVAQVAAELERQLAGGGNGLAEPDAGMSAALEAAYAALVSRADIAALAAGARAAALGGAAGGAVGPAADDSSNIIVEPSTPQSGVEVVHNPSGAGVVAQNSYRRPAALLAYEVSWEDLDGAETEVSPPKLVEQVDVPATDQLELLNALWDAVTFDAPWGPETSEPLRLGGHEGAQRTRYELVLVGPSAAGGSSPIMTDPRFAGEHDAWDDIAFDKSVDLFLNQILVPLVEVYGLGSMAQLDAAKLSKMRERVRLIYDKHLMGLGVYLRAGPTGYVQGMKFVLQEMVENSAYRLDMANMIRDALAESAQNKASIDALDARLASRARASAIVAVVEAVLVGTDVGKVMYDLSASWPEVAWSAVSAPALFVLSPEEGVVTKTESSVKFTVLPRGTTSGNYRYRWTTTGDHGLLSDLLLPDAKVLDTKEHEVWYFHNSPADIRDTDRDNVSVEVFEVPAGAMSIPAGAKPIAHLAAVVRGDTRVIDSRLEVNQGATPADMYESGETFPCVEMLLRFPRDPRAIGYEVRVRGMGGVDDARNPNYYLRTGNGNVDYLMDNAIGANVSDYRGTCAWYNGFFGGDPADWPATEPDEAMGGGGYDARNETMLLMLFSAVDYHDDEDLGAAADLWWEWARGATFEVVPYYPEDEP